MFFYNLYKIMYIKELPIYNKTKKIAKIILQNSLFIYDIIFYTLDKYF